jgi:hypothetical protein
MDTAEKVIRLINKNCFMAKIDLKDASYSVKIKEEYQEGVLYQFTSL